MSLIFEELPHWKQKALYLSVHEGLSGAEISRMLGHPARTTQENIKNLKEVFSKLEIFDPDTHTTEVLGNLDGIGVGMEVGELVIRYFKILFYDIETTLAKAYHFNHWKVNINMKHKIEPSMFLSHAWAWGMDGDLVGSILTSDEVLRRDPERIVLEAWSLLDNCDILVAHNALAFDVKKVNGYFLKYGLPPPSPYKVIDTLQICKKKFRLDFNSLAFVAQYLGVEQKIDTDIDLWIDCDKDDQDSLDEMLAYNIGDIKTLRDVFEKLILWDNCGVNLALYNENTDVACPHCSGDDIYEIKDKFVYTAQRKYQAYRCRGCQATLRSNSKSGVGNKILRVI